MNWFEALPKWIFSAAFSLLVFLVIYLAFSGAELHYADGIRFISPDQLSEQHHRNNSRISDIEKAVNELTQKSTEVSKEIKILASVRIQNGVILASTESVYFERASGIVTIDNPKNLHIVPIISNASNEPYITRTNYIREIISPTKIRIIETSLDTGDKAWEGSNFNLIVIGY